MNDGKVASEECGVASLDEIVRFLDIELKTSEIPDYSGAMNGLQLANSGKVTKVGAAVDASLPVIEKAVAAGVDLLIVHHGLFWQGAQKIVEAQYSKLKTALDADLAIYSSHIPLDVHELYGNNALLSKAIGMDSAEPYFDYKGIKLGLKQELDISFVSLLGRVEEAVGGGGIVCRGRKTDKVGLVGVITGGAGSEVQAMATAGIETFITGEGPHWSFPLAEELGINVIYAGHYATETFGVKAIMGLIANKNSVSKYYVDYPTGL